MHRKQSIIIILFMLISCIVAITAIHRELYNDENEVLYAYLSAHINTLQDVAILSSPTTCRGISQLHMPEASLELVLDFKTKNSKESKPKDLKSLSEGFNVVRFDDAIRIHSAQYPLSSSMNKRIIKLSRVGFDKNYTKALFCIEQEEIGFIVYFEKINGSWKVIKTNNVWIS